MANAVATKPAEKKGKTSASESIGSDAAQLQHSAGASAGMPRFAYGSQAARISPAGSSQPQVQAKCARCEEEEKASLPTLLQHKCACCGGGSCRHGRAGADGVHEAARQGVAGASQPLPHFDRIQYSFGHHDVSSARAQIGGAGAQANERMGSLAYTLGNRISFSKAPNLKLAAHEAAHVVQQRSGAKLPGGVGQPGDEYEQQADAAADAVDRGESAELILDSASPAEATLAEPVVQHQVDSKEALPPLASILSALSGLYFIPIDKKTVFREGSGELQLTAMALLALLGTDYKPGLEVDVLDRLKNSPGSIKFTPASTAGPQKGGEKNGGLHLSANSSLQLLEILKSIGHPSKLGKDKVEVLELGKAATEAFPGVQKLGLPAWYTESLFVNAVAQRAGLLR